MRLTILGCGRFNITANYNSTGNLIETERVNILVDFGRGCLYSLTKLGKQVGDIDAICISHLHPDHIADLLTFFQIFFNTCADKPLIIVGPVGIQQWFKTMVDLVLEPVPTKITIYEQPLTAIEIGDVTVTTAVMKHNVPATAFRFEQAGHSVVYSGDTGMNENIVSLARQTDVLLLECSNQPGQISAQHLNPEQCSDIATQAKVKQLVLTHYGYDLTKTNMPFNGTLVIAKELMTIDL
ncbi:MAG: ribonuclease Z [Patescibacteria group bacterium]|jgi:ribonuclease BN (tRNA processing enzyme)